MWDRRERGCGRGRRGKGGRRGKSGKQGHAPKPDYNTYKPGSYHDFDVGGDKPPVYIGNNNEKKK